MTDNATPPLRLCARSAGAVGEPRRQIVRKPGGQRRAPTAIFQQCDAASKFGDRGNADERTIFVDRIEPRQDLR